MNTRSQPHIDSVRRVSPLSRPLLLNPRVRFLRHANRDYAQVSHIPLTYVSLSEQWRALLSLFHNPQQPLGLPAATSGDLKFLGILHRTGVLLDAESPNPIHDYRGRPGLTRGLYLYPTNSCNLRCVYCYATSGPGAGPRLSLEHALMAVDDFFATLDDEVRLVTLRFHGGGEPTTNFAVMKASWERFAANAHALGLKSSVSTITNGTFGPAVLATLMDPTWTVLVSYDGPRQGVQRPTATAADSRDRVVANLRALSSAGRAVTTRATVTHDGLPFLRELLEDAADLGIRHVQIEPASVVGRGANLADGPPHPLEFADAFLEAFDYALAIGVELTTAAWSSIRVGDGRYCGAIAGARALTPDGFVSACTEACDGSTPDDPFIVGRLDTNAAKLQIWPIREAALAQRTGPNLVTCHSCYLVDTCAGGCASRAQAQTGNAFVRDDINCVASRRINPRMIADLADHRLLPDEGWQPILCHVSSADSAFGDASLASIVPPFALRQWNADPDRRPIFPSPGSAPRFFHRPATPA